MGRTDQLRNLRMMYQINNNARDESIHKHSLNGPITHVTSYRYIGGLSVSNVSLTGYFSSFIGIFKVASFHMINQENFSTHQFALTFAHV